MADLELHNNAVQQLKLARVRDPRVLDGIFVLDIFGLDEFRMRADLLSTKYRNKTRPLCDRWERKTSKLAKSIPKMFFILAKVQALDRN